MGVSGDPRLVHTVSSASGYVDGLIYSKKLIH